MDNKRFVCDICGLVLSANAHLQRHISGMHLKEKNIKCEFCDFKCNQKQNLKKHSCYQKLTSSQNNGLCDYSIEYNIQQKLEKELNGIKGTCPFGRIDILTTDTIIEIKKWTEHKKAIGQILGYASYYPSYKKRIHFFGQKLNEQSMRGLRDVCKFYGIEITEEDY